MLKCRNISKNAAIFYRFLEESDFSTDFHVYGLQWLPDGMRFFVDGVEIGQVNPPPGGFWELGRFDEDPGGHNIWANGTTMTPFDRRVCLKLAKVHHTN